MKPVGVFVDIRGFRRGGLVHRTQISQYLDVPRDVDDEEKIRVISGVVAEGDDVWVKVVDVETTDGAPPRVSLSMKNVDQGNGEDLDPNNLNYEPPFRGGGGRRRRRVSPRRRGCRANGASGRDPLGTSRWRCETIRQRREAV